MSKESACSAGDVGSVSELGRSPGGRHGNLLQYACLKNPMDRGTWRAPVHGVKRSWTRLSNSHTQTHTHTHMHMYIYTHTRKCTYIQSKRLNVKMKHFLSHFCLRPSRAESEVTGSKYFQRLVSGQLTFPGPSTKGDGSHRTWRDNSEGISHCSSEGLWGD